MGKSVFSGPAGILLQGSDVGSVLQSLLSGKLGETLGAVVSDSALFIEAQDGAVMVCIEHPQAKAIRRVLELRRVIGDAEFAKEELENWKKLEAGDFKGFAGLCNTCKEKVMLLAVALRDFARETIGRAEGKDVDFYIGLAAKEGDELVRWFVSQLDHKPGGTTYPDGFQEALDVALTVLRESVQTKANAQLVSVGRASESRKELKKLLKELPPELRDVTAVPASRKPVDQVRAFLEATPEQVAAFLASLKPAAPPKT